MKAEWVAGDGSPSARQLVRRGVALGFGFPFFNVYEPLSFSETATPYARFEICALYRDDEHLSVPEPTRFQLVCQCQCCSCSRSLLVQCSFDSRFHMSNWPRFLFLYVAFLARHCKAFSPRQPHLHSFHNSML